MSPPEKPPKKSPPREDPEGIDLSDFDGEAQKVAGLDLRDAPKKEAPPPAPRPPLIPVELPEGEAATPSASPQRAGPRAAPTPRASAPVLAEDLPTFEPVVEEPKPSRPAAVAEMVATPAPEVEAAPVRGPSRAAEPLAAAPPPHARTPPAAAVEGSLAPAGPQAPPVAAPAGLAPYPPPFGAPIPYPNSAPPIYAPYGAPPAYPPAAFPGFAFPQAPRPAPSPTVEGVARLRVAAGFALGYFALAALHRTYAAMSGATDIPVAQQGSAVGLQFMSFFLTACEACVAALALAACSSGMLRIRESKSEPRLPPADLSRRPLLLLALAAIVPIVAGLAGWVHMSGVQASLPGRGTASDLGLAALYDEYRAAAVALAVASLASSFLIVLGLRGGLAHLAPLVPRRSFRQFAGLFVIASAAHAALLLILLYAVVEAPTRAAGAVARPEFLALVAGPALSALAFVRLRAYLHNLENEAARRHAPKPTK